MRNSLSIKFYLNKYRPQGAKLPIYLRITLDRQKAELATLHFIESKEWNEGIQRTKKNTQVNEYLTSLEQKIYEIARHLEKENKLLTANNIKNHLTEKNKIDAYLIESFDRYKQRLIIAGEVRSETVSYFEVTKKHLQNFLQERKMQDILVKNIDYNFISDFDLFLLNQTISNGVDRLSRNTANKHQGRLRTILIRAIKEGYINKNPYGEFPLKSVPSTRTFLTDEELKQISENSLVFTPTLTPF
jgi:hypothetical protein